LATVLGIVKQHAGFVDVYSELNKGTVFHVHLPACEGLAEPLRHIDDAPVRGGAETILIAEDHEGMREMAREILEGLGYQLHVARDGEEAIQQFLNHMSTVSLVLLDVIMPKLSGIDAYERICTAKADVPVIFTSGYSDHGPLLESLAAQRASILQKPYSAKLLSRRVREILDKAKAMQTR